MVAVPVARAPEPRNMKTVAQAKWAPPVAAGWIGRTAIRALYGELSLVPKPGLVSPYDNGAHSDMTMATFMRSLFALRCYFIEIATAGSAGAPFETLRQLGIAAEKRMLSATGGVNTHRGAIFNLGLLAAAAGRLTALRERPDATEICRSVSDNWGRDILASRPAIPDSHGTRALAAYGGAGAREHAAAGYPLLLKVALPALLAACDGGADTQAKRVQALFAIMAVLDDTNLLHRGGREGLALVQREATAFLDQGGVFSVGWYERSMSLHHLCVAKHLSPGGAADLLACTIFLDEIGTAP